MEELGHRRVAEEVGWRAVWLRSNGRGGGQGGIGWGGGDGSAEGGAERLKKMEIRRWRSEESKEVEAVVEEDVPWQY